MWKRKLFKTRQRLDNWISNNQATVQFEIIFVNNAFGVLWRPLRIIDIE